MRTTFACRYKAQVFGCLHFVTPNGIGSVFIQNEGLDKNIYRKNQHSTKNVTKLFKVIYGFVKFCIKTTLPLKTYLSFITSHVFTILSEVLQLHKVSFQCPFPTSWPLLVTDRYRSIHSLGIFFLIIGPVFFNCCLESFKNAKYKSFVFIIVVKNKCVMLYCQSIREASLKRREIGRNI